MSAKCHASSPSAPSKRAILVTGGPRTGTTWVGKMLASSPSVGYLHEPFSPHASEGIRGFPLTDWFLYLCGDNGAPYVRPLSRMLAFRYHVVRGYRSARGPRSIVQVGRDRTFFRAARRLGMRVLQKDPVAVFSALWLADTFDMEVVALVRHPAPFVNSVLRIGAPVACGRLLDQPLLVRDLLAPFSAELERLRESKPDPLGEAAMLWRLTHCAVETYGRRRPSWNVIRHDEIAARPLSTFLRLHERLGIPFTAATEKEILYHSSSQHPRELAAPFDIRLHSSASLDNWRHRLTAGQIERIRELTSDGAPFYGADDW